jgi:photosystem II stability/assembly factor-like uncharacterized protein
MTAQARYDVFLSYNSADEEAVGGIARRLREEAKLRPFLDRWHLIPGEPWQEAIEEALEESETVAIFVGPSGISPWHNEEMRAGLDRAVRGRDDVRVIPVLLPGADPKLLPSFLTRRTCTDFRAGLDDDDTFARLVAGILGQPPEQAGAFTLPDEPTPYPGLLPFTARQADFFFGRTDERDRLLGHVRESPFVAVVGASGSGKSSLVLAGLLPALDKGWHTLTLVPGERPLRAQADQLATLVPPADRLRLADDLEKRLLERTDGFRTAVYTLLTGHPKITTLLIVVDQFEELFTHVSGTPEEVRRQQCQFVANLFDAARTSRSVLSPSRHGQVRVVLTLRADFVKHCLDFPDLRALLESNQLLLGPMGEEALREAIVRPAQAVGAMFEKGLVGRLMEDVRRQRAALPLMQSALAQLWRRRRGVWLTHAAYKAIGGVSGAIDQRAEAVYTKLSEPQKRLARNLFLRLVALGEDTSDTRRRVRREELDLVGTTVEDMEELVGVLSRSDVRLVTADADTIELAHEALIEQWGRLWGWLGEDRAALRIHQQLTNVAQEWGRHGRDTSYLYRGSRLAKVEQWQKTSTANLSRLEHDFITASIAARRAELAARRQRQALRAAVFGLSVLVGIALVVLLWMFVTGTGLFETPGEWIQGKGLDTRVNVIAVGPQDPSVVYAGTRDRGVCKSSDRGLTWKTVLETEQEVQSLAMSLNDPGTLYAGTRGGRLLRSVDAGANWAEVGRVLDAEEINDLLVDPVEPEILYACDVGLSCYQSLDGGAGWVIIDETSNVSTIAVAATEGDGTVLYLGTRDGLLLRSMDRGETWHHDPEQQALPYITDIAVSPKDSDLLYVGTLQGLYRFQVKEGHFDVQTMVADQETVAVTVDPLAPYIVFTSVFNGRIHLVQQQGDSFQGEEITRGSDFPGSSLTPHLVAGDHDPCFLYAATAKGVFAWEPSRRQENTWFGRN